MFALQHCEKVKIKESPRLEEHLANDSQEEKQQADQTTVPWKTMKDGMKGFCSYQGIGLRVCVHACVYRCACTCVCIYVSVWCFLLNCSSLIF